MDKLLVSICALALPMTASAQQDQGQQIDLQVGIINPDGVLGGGHKGPAQVLYATLNDHTLYIWSQHNGYSLTLLDDNDTVVYQSYVAPGVQYAVLPSTLSGSYTLVLSDDTYMFTGMLELE